jgi:TorA maturation chaperone TorD
METAALLSAEKERAEAYRVLSQCYYLPTKDLIEELESMEQCVSVVCTEAAQHVSRMKEELEKTHDLKSLQVDYSKLFVGPYQLLAAPYGSVYLEGERRVMADSTMDARNLYREVGVDISGDFQEAPDHIAVELEFMHLLIFKEIEAISCSDFEETFRYLKKQEGFLSSHLGAWIAEFADHVERNAETQFYKQLARTTKVFVSKDLMENLAGSMPLIEDSSTVSAKHGRLEAESGVQ